MRKDPTGRALQLLSLLQAHRLWRGAELAERLEVSERTVRRDVDRLRRRVSALHSSVIRCGGQPRMTSSTPKHSVCSRRRVETVRRCVSITDDVMAKTADDSWSRIYSSPPAVAGISWRGTSVAKNGARFDSIGSASPDWQAAISCLARFRVAMRRALSQPHSVRYLVTMKRRSLAVIEPAELADTVRQLATHLIVSPP